MFFLISNQFYVVVYVIVIVIGLLSSNSSIFITMPFFSRYDFLLSLEFGHCPHSRVARIIVIGEVIYVDGSISHSFSFITLPSTSEWEVDNYFEKIRNDQGQYWLFRGLIQQFACFLKDLDLL